MAIGFGVASAAVIFGSLYALQKVLSFITGEPFTSGDLKWSHDFEIEITAEEAGDRCRCALDALGKDYRFDSEKVLRSERIDPEV